MGTIKDITNPYGVFNLDLTYIYSNFRKVRLQKKGQTAGHNYEGVCMKAQEQRFIRLSPFDPFFSEAKKPRKVTCDFPLFKNQGGGQKYSKGFFYSSVSLNGVYLLHNMDTSEAATSRINVSIITELPTDPWSTVLFKKLVVTHLVK